MGVCSIHFTTSFLPVSFFFLFDHDPDTMVRIVVEQEEKGNRQERRSKMDGTDGFNCPLNETKGRDKGKPKRDKSKGTGKGDRMKGDAQRPKKEEQTVAEQKLRADLFSMRDTFSLRTA